MRNANRAILMVVCLMATFIISGVVSTMGLVVPGAAEKFGVSVTDMASQFTWFTGGVFAGYVLSFVIFDYVSIRLTLLVSYVLCGAALCLIHLTGSLPGLSALLGLFGFSISVGVCGSGTLITQVWDGRARQTVIVAQDALFNGGGLLFSALATWFIARQFGFGATYLVLAVVVLLSIILALTADFNKDLLPGEQRPAEGETQWNAGFILVGISLALFMLAKITMFIWAPQYLVAQFATDATAGGEFMSRVFLAALIGSLAGVWLVSRVSVKVLVYVYVVVSVLGICALLASDSLSLVMLVAYIYGFSVSATFNAYVAFSLTLVARPNHRNIAYMLLMSSLGSSLAPLVSSAVVAGMGRMSGALQFCVAALAFVLVALIVGEAMARRGRAGQSAPMGPVGSAVETDAN